MRRGMPHKYGFNRPDPFFASTAPHKNSLLESLHRSYGEPTGALPARDDEAFQRAIEFRKNEKHKYATMETENERLRAHVETLEAGREALMAETTKIKALWEELSKRETKDEPAPKPRTRRDRSVQSRDGATEPAPKPAKSRPATRSRNAVPRDEKADVVKADGEEDVRREVLPADVRDARGQAPEHAPEGSEPRSGAEPPTEEGESSGTVREDEE